MRIVTSITALAAALIIPVSSHAIKVRTLPKDSTVSMSLSTHTGDQIKMQRLRQDVHIITPGGTDLNNTSVTYQDSVRHMMDLFFYDQYSNFQDPLAPYFMLMSKEAHLALGVGGAVRLRGWYDFAGSIDNRGFAPYLIPVPSNPAQRRYLGGTPAGTAMFLRIIGRNRVLGDIVGYIQTEFSAQSNTLKLKKAYAKISDWTIGYTATAFNDPAAEAPTIDGAQQAGLASRSALEVRWDHSFKRPWDIGASVAMPESQIAADNTTTQSIRDWFPDIAAYFAYRLPYDGHVRLAGMARVLPYRNLIKSENSNRMGWGVQLSSLYYPIPRLGIYFEANTGQGYSAYMGDLSIGQYDLIDNPDKPGQMYAPWALGINVGCKFNFSTKVYACMALAEARYFTRPNASPDEYKYGLYGSWSCFYEPSPRIQMGIEYLHGRRNNVNHEHGSANRVDALFQLSF